MTFGYPNFETEKSNKDNSVQGDSWMAIRQKKAEEKQKLERQKREQEMKEKRKNQTEALKVRSFQNQFIIFVLFLYRISPYISPNNEMRSHNNNF